MTINQRQQLLEKIRVLEADLTRSRQAIHAFEGLLFSYSQLADQQAGFRLIIDTTDQLVAERQQYETITTQYEEILDELGRLTSQGDQ
ncbi:hypothetical protein [Spirosoma endbachense]|uniref:Uncharacterized protein n=1 Tax=Spirosoma endbachense TaxID=2666025 RepID=A0A6P1VXK4_9BACT|nr:hypothetical protein [Spirosoma endbachense]QHV96560.1 hypothetical protein GJR95_16750 [Spirosoma endbachense]